jgi:hypothetical protein
MISSGAGTIISCERRVPRNNNGLCHSCPIRTQPARIGHVWFGDLGGIVYVLAVIATVVLAVLLRGDRGWRWPVAVAAGLQVPPRELDHPDRAPMLYRGRLALDVP